MGTARGGHQKSGKRCFYLTQKNSAESYTTPVLLTALYMAVHHDSDSFGRIAEHDKMCD